MNRTAGAFSGITITADVDVSAVPREKEHGVLIIKVRPRAWRKNRNLPV